jgi:outer membrane biosynthesis protein TonB
MVQPVEAGTVCLTVVGRVGIQGVAMQVRRSAVVAVGVMLGATVLAGCSGSNGLPTPSLTESRSEVTASRPEATASRPDRSTPEESRELVPPAESAAENPKPKPESEPAKTEAAETEAATSKPQPEPETTTAKRNPPNITRPSATATAEQAQEPTTAANPTPSSSPAAVPTSAESQTPWWPWLLLLVPIVGLIAWLVARSSRRRDWDASYAGALDEVRWVARSFAPALANRALPPAGASQYWLEGRPRLDDLQAELVALSTSAPDDALSATLTRASVSLAALSQALETDVALRGAVAVTPETAASLDQSFRLIGQRCEGLLMDIGDITVPDGYPGPGYPGPEYPGPESDGGPPPPQYG